MIYSGYFLVLIALMRVVYKFKNNKRKRVNNEDYYGHLIKDYYSELSISLVYVILLALISIFLWWERIEIMPIHNKYVLMIFVFLLVDGIWKVVLYLRDYPQLKRCLFRSVTGTVIKENKRQLNEVFLKKVTLRCVFR